MFCEHGRLRWVCGDGCKTDADRDAGNRDLVDETAALFRRKPGAYDAVGIHAFNHDEAQTMLAYARARHPDVPFVIASTIF